MGREKLLEALRKKYKRELILVIFLMLLFLAGGLFLSSMIYRVICFVMVGIMAWLALAQYACVDDINRSSELKEHPEILDMADEHFANITYEDKFITVSDRMIASAKKPFEIAFLEEVYMVHISKDSMNLIPTGKELHISHGRGTIDLNIYGVKKSVVDGLFERLRPLCPNACAGYTQDNLKYLAYKRQQWANGVGVVPVKRPEVSAEEPKDVNE